MSSPLPPDLPSASGKAVRTVVDALDALGTDSMGNDTLDGLRDAQVRTGFASMLREDLSDEFTVTGHQYRHDLTLCARAALRHVGGLDALCETVGAYFGAPAAAVFSARIAGARAHSRDPLAPVFPEEASQEVQSLLGQVTRFDLALLRSQLAAELHQVVPVGPSLADTYRALLDSAAQPDGLHPALVFVEYVAATQSAGTREALRNWGERMSGTPGGSGALRQLRTRIGARTPREAPRSIVIMVDPAQDGSPDVVVRHWVNSVAGGWEPLPGEVELATLETLESAVRNAIGAGEREWARTARENAWDDDASEYAEEELIYVEFLLPYSLLNDDFAWLALEPASSDPLPLGRRYCVHLRSLDRMRSVDDAQRRRWQARWRRLTKVGAPRFPESGSDQWRRSHLAHDELTAVVLDSAAIEGRGLEALRMAIVEGIGLALWDRRESQPVEAREMLRLLAGNPYRQLPQQLLKLRSMAADDVNGLHFVGRHIACLWDDPFRLVDCEEESA